MKTRAGLTLTGRAIGSVFSLLGAEENDLTKSLGFVLDRSLQFRHAFAEDLGMPGEVSDVATSLQTSGPDRGFTDIELSIPGQAHAILEAKRGWLLPGVVQLARYHPRLEQSAAPWTALITVSDCSAEFVEARGGLPRRLKDTPVRHLSWGRIIELTAIAHARARGVERVWLREFSIYLDEVIRVRREDTNLVYCVSLAAGAPSGWAISWRDIVDKRRRYFHPLAKNWPAEPPTYLAFRYDGQLQSIHHVDAWQVVTRMHDHLSEIPDTEWEPHFLYTLGPPMRPSEKVKNGAIFPMGRYWCMLDLLLTAASVRDARDGTKRRLGAEHARRLAQTEEGGGE